MDRCRRLPSNFTSYSVCWVPVRSILLSMIGSNKAEDCNSGLQDCNSGSLNFVMFLGSAGPTAAKSFPFFGQSHYWHLQRVGEASLLCEYRSASWRRACGMRSRMR